MRQGHLEEWATPSVVHYTISAQKAAWLGQTPEQAALEDAYREYPGFEWTVCIRAVVSRRLAIAGVSVQRSEVYRATIEGTVVRRSDELHPTRGIAGYLGESLHEGDDVRGP